jgi:hypothetical protein
MLHLLIDTCVWLDLSKDYRSQPLISALEELITADEVKLIVPQIVVDEFLRNKARVIAEAERSLQSHFRLVREAVNQFGAGDRRNQRAGDGQGACRPCPLSPGKKQRRGRDSGRDLRGHCRAVRR